jgi:hypothetical protein
MYGDSANPGWRADFHIDVLVTRERRRAALARSREPERTPEEEPRYEMKAPPLPPPPSH